MKTLISLVLCILFLNVSGQNSSIFKKSTNDLFAMNVQFKSKKIDNVNYASDKMKIDMRYLKYKDANENKTAGLILLISGIAFTTASILESGDFTIYQGETSRQIMLGVGIGLTITGAGISLKN
jgi:hypothetical protein